MLWLSSKLKEIFVQDIAAIIAFAGYLLISLKFGISCPILVVFHIPCPACGMTRAMFSLMRFNLADYIRYNALALPVAFAIILQMHKGLFFKYKGIIDVVSICIIVLNFIYYIYRLII